ncbi:MAG TPA: extracellular solute-binding protein [Acidimicrobiales bacterium]|nr:extracellular solute-binding protein [Acidimicrobiales bacterium]
MAIAVLGPLSLDGDMSLLRRRDRVVLEALVVRSGRSVSADQLADALWGEQVPPSWSKVIQGCVVRLRKVLGRDAIETVHDGYRLVVGADDVDTRRFEQLVARSRELLVLGEHERAAYVSGQALALWRGPPFADLDGWDPGIVEAGRLDELRLDAEEIRLDAALRAGRHREVLSEAFSSVKAAPLRERRWGLLALAQYQTGRQADALRTLHEARRVLVEEAGVEPGPELAALEQAILRQDPTLVTAAALPEPSATCPYLGLVPYDIGDADAFFGREAEVEQCLQTLSRSGVLAVVGPSGSGKSSLVRAGIAAALQRSGRRVVIVTPGTRPMDALTALSPAGPDAVLVVDQCEEAVTLCDDPDERTRFFDALVELSEQRTSVVALRADHLGSISAYPAFVRRIEPGLHLLSAMGEADLRAAIEGPARQTGLLLQPGLVDLVVRDVEGEPGALPMLSHALRETWARREGRTLTVDGYRATGGIRGAIAQSAEAVYERVPEEQRATLRDLLLRLVTPTPEGEPVRTRVPRRLVAGDKAHERLVELLVQARLVTSDEGVVELAHESLARAWPRLRAWLDDDVDGQRILRHLTSAADAWDALGRPDSELYRGVRLAQALEWWERADPVLNVVERSFLDASAAKRDAEHAVEEQRRRREDRLRRQTRRRSRLLLGGAVVLAAVVALAAFAIVQRNAAARSADQLAATEEARRLSVASAAVAEDDPELAMLLALQALEKTTRAEIPALGETEDALHWAIQGARLAYPVADSRFGWSIDVRIGPNGRTGTYGVPVADLVALARGHVTRPLTDAECSTYRIEPCPVDGSGLASPASAGPRRVLEPPEGDVLAGTPSLTGTTVTMWGVDDAASGLKAELDRFEEATGIHVSYEARDVYAEIPPAIERGDVPDIAIAPQPGAVRDLGARGELVDLSTYLDVEAARAAFSDYLVDLASESGGLYGLPLNIDVKGLVWYPVPEFHEAGYTVPRTWDELIALSERMVADGRTPWCLGLESGLASGWPATDWVEAIVFRLGGVEAYERWIAHEMRFTDPMVRQATAMFGEIAFGEGFVDGGAPAVTTGNFFEVAEPLSADPPGCWLYHMASFAMNGGFQAVVQPGADADFFPLPPMEAGQPVPAFGGAGYIGAFRDRPEVRELMRHILRPSWGEAWAAASDAYYVPAHAGFDPQRCASENADPRSNPIRVQLCELSRESIAAGEWRFDASDVMPPEIGADAFWKGMVDYVGQGPGSLDRILGEIDAAWPSAPS